MVANNSFFAEMNRGESLRIVMREFKIWGMKAPIYTGNGVQNQSKSLENGSLKKYHELIFVASFRL
jgi:hypothetical protein